jgi:hypothetical protein
MDTALINSVNKTSRVPPPSGGLGSDITPFCLVFQAVWSDSDSATGTTVLGGFGSDSALGAVVLQAFWSASGSASGPGNAAESPRERVRSAWGWGLGPGGPFSGDSVSLGCIWLRLRRDRARTHFLARNHLAGKRMWRGGGACHWHAPEAQWHTGALQPPPCFPATAKKEQSRCVPGLCSFLSGATGGRPSGPIDLHTPPAMWPEPATGRFSPPNNRRAWAPETSGLVCSWCAVSLQLLCTKTRALDIRAQQLQTNKGAKPVCHCVDETKRSCSSLWLCVSVVCS